MDVVVQAARIILIVVFTWAAVAKIMRPDQWLAALRPYRLHRLGKAVGLFGVPWMEVAVVILLLVDQQLEAGLLSLLLLSAFSLAIVRLQLIMHAAAVRCGCFGMAKRGHDYRLLLARNAGLAAASIILMVADEEGWGSWRPAHIGSGALVLAWGSAAGAWIVWRAITLIRRREPA